MSRTRNLIASGLLALATATVFALFIGFRRNTALVGALEAAGTVAAAVFAALAATGSLRAAAESSSAARRSREALARATRPRIHPSVSRENGSTLGKVRCGEGRGAVDVTIAWVLANRDNIIGRTPRLEPGSDIAFAVDLKLAESANTWEEITMVWIEYWDDSRIGHWQDSWQLGAEPHNQGVFLQTDSRLVD